MKTIRAALAALTILCSAVVAAPTESIPVDAAGRPLKDDRDQRLEYATPGVSSHLLVPGGARTVKSQVTASGKKIAPRMQSTGVSPSYVEAWRTSFWGSGIGATGFWPVDVDNDGDMDFVAGGGDGFGGNAFWSIITFDDDAATYEIAWQSAPYFSSGSWSPAISALRVVEVGNTKRAWIGRSDGSVDVVNLLTRETVQSLAPSASAIVDFAIADADNDGSVDVIIVTGTQTFLYDPIALALRRTVAYGGGRVAVGNVDADGNLETVYSTGHVVEITTGSTALQWSSPTAFGARIDLADIDGDGFAELLGADAWYVIRAIDLDTQSLKWTFNADLDIGAFRLIDVAGTPVPEIVYGDGQWGDIHVVDVATQTELWSIPNPEHGTTDVAVFDADGDGSREILWGAGWSSTGPDYLFVHDLATRTREWQSEDFSGPFEAVDIGDVDADGKVEIVVASFQSRSGYSDGQIMVFDAQTNVREWISSTAVFDNQSLTGVHALKLANIDADAQLEIIVGTDRLYDGALYVIDGLTHERQGYAVYDSGSPLSVLDIADVTGDGNPDVIAGNEVAHTGSPGAFLYVLNPRSDEIVWQSAMLAGGFSAVTDVTAADAGNAGLDIIAVSSSVHSIRWSDKRHLTSATSGYVSVAVGDVDPAAGNEIIAGTATGTLDILDGETLAIIETHDVCDAPINAIEMHAAGQIIAACGRQLVVYSIAASTLVDTTLTGIDNLGNNSALVRGIVDGRAIVVTGGSRAVKFIDGSTNNLPTVTGASATVHWRSSIDVQLSAADADDDPLRFELASLPGYGSATWVDAVAGTLRYSPTAPRTGSDSLTVRASDGSQYSSAATVALTITNSVPTASTAALSFHWRGTQTATLGAADPDGDPLTFSIATAPTKGSIAIDDAATGRITFTPSAAFVGSDALTYAVTDGPDSQSRAVQITLTNTTPVPANTNYDISPSVTIHGRVSVVDADNDPLTYSIVQQPARGSISLEAATGLFQYVPASGVTAATDTVIFSISDGITQVQATGQFRYPTPPSSSGGGGGGGALGVLALVLLAPFLLRGTRHRWARR